MADTRSDLLSVIMALGPEIAARAEETERNRGIATDLVAGLRAGGLFRMMVPRRYGGLELSLSQAVRVIEELAKSDGSAGWMAMVIFGWNIAFGRFAPRIVQKIFSGGPDVVARGALAPLGVAVPVEGGYQISGQWPFASGSYDPEWIVGTCIVMTDGKPQIGPGGIPVMRSALLPGNKAKFLDSWYSVGLNGSASHDFVVKDVFVPEDYTTNFFDPAVPPAYDTPLLKLPFASLAGPTHSAVAIGIAQGALDELSALARTKRSAFNPMARLGEDPVFRHKLGELAVRLNALRALMNAEVDTIERTAQAGAAGLLPLDFAAATSAVAYTHVECVEIVNEAFGLAGSVPVYSKSSLQRRWRDVRCAAQHVGASVAAFQSYGALLAGEPIATGPLGH